jgi:ankyrin repeat protein
LSRDTRRLADRRLRIVNVLAVSPMQTGTIRLLTPFLMLALAACDQATVEQRAGYGLHELARQGETQQLLRAVADTGRVDQRDVCYRTPLMFAAQFGQIETVERLLAAGARVDLHEKGYYTALMLAAGNGHSEVVRMLAAAGAKIDEVEISRGWTALIWAAQRGHADTVGLLLALGADHSRRDHQGRSARDWALARGQVKVAALL